MANYFTDRVVEYPGRVTMTPVEGEQNVYDMERNEGTVTEAGTPFKASTFNEIAQDIIDQIPIYGTCDTAGNEQTKVVVAPGFTLRTGAIVVVKFTYRNTYQYTTRLNVNSTGPINVRAGAGPTHGSNTDIAGLWEPEQPAMFVYDGTYWRLVNPVAITAVGTTGGWSWKKYPDGTMTAEKVLSTGNTWTTVVSPVANNLSAITKPPDMLTVTGGSATIQQPSAYVINAQVQINAQGNPQLSVHRLSTGAATIDFRVVLNGTWK